MDRPWTLLVALAALAGCAQPGADGGADALERQGADGGPSEDTGEAGDVGGPSDAAHYALVWITGNFTHHPPEGQGGGVCGYLSPPEVDEARQSIRFPNPPWEPSAQRNVSRLGALVLVTQWDSSGCGVMETQVVAHWDGGVPESGITLLGGVALRLHVHDGGLVLVLADERPDGEAEAIAPGGERQRSYAGTASDGGRFEGDYRLRAMGAWPVEGLAFRDP